MPKEVVAKLAASEKSMILAPLDRTGEAGSWRRRRGHTRGSSRAAAAARGGKRAILRGGEFCNCL